jgi:hypothetical protein
LGYAAKLINQFGLRTFDPAANTNIEAKVPAIVS